MPLPLPTIVEPNADKLLHMLGQDLPTPDLRSIAGFDCGYDFEKHYEALLSIKANGVRSPLRHHPGEVLNLVKWAEPDPKAGPYAMETEHCRRAFACAALLRALGNEHEMPPDWSEGQMGSNTTLIQLIASLRILGYDKYDRPAAALRQWLIPLVPETERSERAFFGLGLLWFALDATVQATDDDLIALAEWVMVEEDAEAAHWRDFFAGPQTPWLLSTTTFEMRHHVWRAFGGWLIERGSERPALAELVALIAMGLREPES